MTNSHQALDPIRLDPHRETITKHCERHGDYEARTFAIGSGFPTMTSNCPACLDERAAAERVEAAAAAERVRLARCTRLWDASGIPKRFASKRLSGYEAKDPQQRHALEIATRFVARFADKPDTSLLLCGTPGTGKTHLACGIAAALLDAGHSVVIATEHGAMRWIKETYRKDSELSESDAIARLIEPELLIMDEVGVQTGSEHEKMLVFEIINERYQACKATILISNLTASEVEKYLGDRVTDRFRECGAIVAFNWKSYRCAHE
jgi:DNA replication protein DnaC